MSKPTGEGGLANADSRLFETGSFADATIVCGERTWKVHKALLSSRCKWFERAFFGNLAEAASGKIVLEEQDPDLIDVMLRFIYSRSINIAKLTDGKDIPALCVNLFRVADFFLLKELQINVMKALRVHLDRLLVIPDNGDITSLPARMSEVNEVLESIKEAYKDNSTVHLREMLLGFLWMRNSRIFQIPKVALLLSEIPELGKDLMLTYISGDGTAHLHDTTKAPQGLLVYEAIREPAQIYKTGDKKASTKGGSKAICLLRHTPGRPSPFEVVDAKTGALIKELAWITPAICQISWIGSHETSEIVCIREKEDRHGYKKLWLRFETAGDARYYTGCHSGVDRQIQQNKCTKALLQTDMREAHDRVCGPDGT